MSKFTPAQQLQLGIMGALTDKATDSMANSIRKAFQPDPDAQRRAADTEAVEAMRRQQQEAERRAHEAQHQQLMSSLKSLDDGSRNTGPSRNLPGNFPPVGQQKPVQWEQVYKQGYSDATGCVANHNRLACTEAGAQIDDCVAHYNAAYALGERETKVALDEAYQRGRTAAATGQKDNAVFDSAATADCHLEMTESYNRGYFDEKRSHLVQ